MRIPSTPRRSGARSKPVHFTYVSTERGQPYEAYLAGPVWWGYLHMLRPSKPCVYELTGEKVACRFCGAKKAGVAVVKGWVPLYRRPDGTAICVPVDEVQRDHLDALKCFSKVVVGRERGKGVGVFVRAAANQDPAWSSSLPEYSNPADITESLINMWALPEVFAFFGGKVVSDNAVSLAESADGAARPRGEVRTEETRDCLDAATARMRGGVDDAVRRLLVHAKQVDAPQNGQH